jgi:hypothetical protein
MQSSTPIQISEAVSRTAKMKAKTYDWEDFSDKILNVFETDETSAQYAAASKDDRSAIKDVGGYVMGVFDKSSSRKSEDFAYRTGVSLDADHIEDSIHARRVIKKVRALGYECLVTSTHSHTSASPRLRFIFPLLKPVDDSEKFEALCRLVASKIDIDAFDSTGYQSSRLMFWSSRSKGADFISTRVKGSWLDVDNLLKEYGQGDAWKDRLIWPRSYAENEQAVLRSHADKAGNPLEKPGIIGLFNQCYDIPDAIDKFLSDVYTPTVGNRYTYAQGSSSNGAVVYDEGLFLYSHHESDPCRGRSVNAWDMVRLHKFGHMDQRAKSDTPIGSMPSSIAMRDWAKTLDEFSQFAVSSAADDFRHIAESSSEENVLDVDRWVYMTHSDTFFDLRTGTEYARASLNTAFGRFTPDVNVSRTGRILNNPKEVTTCELLTNYLRCKVVKEAMYYPQAKSGVFEFEGEFYANSFIESSVPESDPNWAATGIREVMLEYIHGLVNDVDAAMLLQFLAHNVQFPGMKIAWCPIIKGIPGDGKTTLAMILAAAMGRKHVKVISTQEVSSQFNEWAHGSCLGVMEEIRISGHNRHDVMNTLKPLITNDVISVIGKGKKGLNVLNTQNYIAFTNHEDALAIDHTDRRWYPMFTHYNHKDDLMAAGRTDDYFSHVYATISKRIAAIRGWLLSVDLSSFNRHKAPETTQNKHVMILNSLSYGTRAVLNAIELGGMGVCEEVISTQHLNDLIAEIEGKKIQTQALAKALSECGYEKYEYTAHSRTRFNGRRTFIYVKTRDLTGRVTRTDFTRDEVFDKLDETMSSDFDEVSAKQ